MDSTQTILSPFMWPPTFFYNPFGSYGIALILLTVVVKFILFPSALKGKWSMIQMSMLQGKTQKLQKQYGRDHERYDPEVRKPYKWEKVSPMGGCLRSLLPLLTLIPLYVIIRQPIKYMMGINGVEILNQITQMMGWNSIAVSNDWIKEAGEAFSSVGYNRFYLSSLITLENPGMAKVAVGEVGSRIFAVNFDFLGLADLARILTLKFWTVAGGFALLLLPVMSAGSSLVFPFISMKVDAVNQQAAQAGNDASMRSMIIISPLIFLQTGFSMSAVLRLYWIAQNLLNMVWELICGKLLKKDYERAAAARVEQEHLEKEGEKEERRRKTEERARRIEEAKPNKGKKKKTEKKYDEDEDKIPGSVKEHSRMDLHQHARGWTYDPYRYSGEGPAACPEEAPIFPPRSDSCVPKREAHGIEEELREIHTDEAIEGAILEKKALEAPIRGETKIVSAGEEPKTEDDTDKAKE